MQGYAKNIQAGKEIQKVWGLGNIHVAHKKETASALKAARRDHLNGNLQTSLEEKNTKPFHTYINAQKNVNFAISTLKFNGLMYSDS